ncbi:hypothetical protein NVP1123O_05 [Vibrio phage 1.123.O._10N.286.48.F3]|nr:hypothetical protein NVP1123O_05 [Vibrio phage 1.123.O._10N.286.48.F3]
MVMMTTSKEFNMCMLIDTRTESLYDQTKYDAAEFQAALQKAFDEREDDE